MRTIVVSNACPNFFRACCREASRGGTRGYAEAGYVLARSLAYLRPNESDADSWAAEVDRLLEFVCPVVPPGRGSGGTAWGVPDDAGALACLDELLPRCMELVPPRRRNSFLAGLCAFLRDEEGDAGL